MRGSPGACSTSVAKGATRLAPGRRSADHQRDPPHSALWRSLARLSIRARGPRLSRFRSYSTVRCRHRFPVLAFTSANGLATGRRKIEDKDRIKGTVEQAKGAVKEALAACRT